MATVLQMIASLDAGSMARTVEEMQLQADRLGKTLGSYTAKVDDTTAQASILKMTMRADKLQEKLKTDLSIDGVQKAALQLLSLEGQADRLNRKLGDLTANVGVDRSWRSKFGGLFGGNVEKALGGVAGITGGGGGGGGGIGAAPWLWGGGGVLAALLVPALLPTALGLGIGGGGAALGLALGAKANKQIQQLGQQLSGITGNTPADKKKIAQITAQMAAIRQANAGPVGVFGALQDVGHQALGVFSGALTAPGAGNVLTGAAGPSFLTGLTGILKQLGGFIKTIGPQLASMFQASIPYLSMFVKFMEQSAKVLLPVFTQMLKQMTPYLPLMAKGLLAVVQGLAGFLKAIGPQAMQTSAKAFVLVAQALQIALTWLGWYVNRVGERLPGYLHDVAVAFDTVRHNVAVWALAVAHAFDTLKSGVLDWWHFWVNTWHLIVGAAQSAWNILVKGVKDSIGTILHLFTGLPDQAIHALWGLGHSLAAFMRSAFSEMWTAAKNVGGDILHWITSWASNLWHGLLHFFHIGSPSGLFYDIGKNLMLGLRNGIQDHIKGAAGAAQAAAAAVSIHGGPGGGSPAANAALARRMMPAWASGAEWAAWNAVAMRESGWSQFAYNPSGATGIPQALPYTKMPRAAWLPSQGGQANPAAQIAWMISYIQSTYGDPIGAWQHELTHGWYDRGGWLPPGLSLALNTTGKPERVGGGSGATYIVNVNVPVSANKAEVGRQVVETIREFEKRSGAGWRS